METVSKPKARGRPREFSCDEALDAATRVFWEKGYDGASLTDLTKAMGIKRTSMYWAFGNKEALYRKTMERYAETREKFMSKSLDGGTVREGMRRLLRGAVETYCDPKYPGGCYATKGLLTGSAVSAKMRKEIVKIREAVLLILQKRFERAVKDGELPSKTSPADLARFYAVVLQGLGLHAKVGGTKDDLERVAEVAMEKFPSKS
jgi:AcrR family transcriptional regulator